MAYDLEEQESIDQFKAWWDKWGNILMTALTVVLLGVAAFNGWRWYKSYTASKAGFAYSQMAPVLVEAKDTDRIARMANGIFDDYGRTVYAPLAGLQAAGALARAGKADQARAMLERTVKDSAGHDELATIARIRLAGLELDAGHPDKALAALDGAKPAGLGRITWNDRRGDVLFAMKKMDEAKKAWQEANRLTPQDHPMKPLIGLKLATLFPPAK